MSYRYVPYWDKPDCRQRHAYYPSVMYQGMYAGHYNPLGCSKDGVNRFACVDIRGYIFAYARTSDGAIEKIKSRIRSYILEEIKWVKYWNRQECSHHSSSQVVNINRPIGGI